MNYKRAIITIATLGFTYFIVTRVGLNAQQWSYIRRLNPKAKQKFKDFIKAIEDGLGYSVVITSGYRTFEKQQSLYDSGKTTAKGGRSYHNYGMAIDINAVKLGTWLRMGSPKVAWEESGIPQLAENMGLRWGGNFSNFYDPVHFDLGYDYNLNDLEQTAYQLYGQNPSDIKGNKV